MLRRVLSCPAAAAAAAASSLEYTRGSGGALARAEESSFESEAARKKRRQEAVDLEARRLQQLFLEVERETMMQREVEVASEREVLEVELKTKMAERREALSRRRAEKAAEAETEAKREAGQALSAFDKSTRDEKQKEVDDFVADAEKKVEEALQEKIDGWKEARRATEAENESRVDAMNEEIGRLRELLRLKDEEAEKEKEIYRLTLLTMRVVSALESRMPSQEAIEDLLKEDVSPVIRHALLAIPEANRLDGTPQFDHLEDRFVGRVAEAVKLWLLVPQDGVLNNGVLAHGLAHVFARVGFTSPPLALEPSQDSKTAASSMELLKEATTVLEYNGDLAGCIEKLNQLPPKHDPSPAADWIQDAKARILADQAITVLRTKIALLCAEQLR